MSEQSQIAPSRRRFSPEKRRAMILDCTADIVARDGIATLSMEQIGKEAGVSKSLVYNYFESLTALLRELLTREYRRLRRIQSKAVEDSSTLEDLVRNVTHVYLKYIEERGPIIARLQAEPSISDNHDPTTFDRDRAVEPLALIMSDALGLPMTQARAVVDISFGIPAAAGEYVLRGVMSRAEVEDFTVAMILASLMGARDDYLTRRVAIKKATGPAKSPRPKTD